MNNAQLKLTYQDKTKSYQSIDYNLMTDIIVELTQMCM